MTAPADRSLQFAAQPPGFTNHRHQRRFVVQQPRHLVWAWLNDPATFTEGQVWPFRVEFLGGGFEDGVVCNHHGPFLSLPGVLRAVDAPRSRELHYLYGSYALTPRWVRPSRLRFDLEELDGGAATAITLQLESWTRPWMNRVWTALQGLFWWGFIATAGRCVRRHARRVAAAAA